MYPGRTFGKPSIEDQRRAKAQALYDAQCRAAQLAKEEDERRTAEAFKKAQAEAKSKSETKK